MCEYNVVYVLFFVIKSEIYYIFIFSEQMLYVFYFLHFVVWMAIVII